MSRKYPAHPLLLLSMLVLWSCSSAAASKNQATQSIYTWQTVLLLVEHLWEDCPPIGGKSVWRLSSNWAKIDVAVLPNYIIIQLFNEKRDFRPPACFHNSNLSDQSVKIFSSVVKNTPQSYSNYSLAPGYDTLASQSTRRIIPRGVKKKSAKTWISGMSNPGESIYPEYHTMASQEKIRQNMNFWDVKPRVSPNFASKRNWSET